MGPFRSPELFLPMRTVASLITALAALALPSGLRAADAPPDFSAVYRILDERCIECHAKDDYEGGLVLEDHAGLLKGGESGKAVIPGKSQESLLVKYLHGDVLKDGKKR